ncbi:MAG: hypothetical protein KKF56_00310 [Nanoarchaeota archaeon]|nr:hypothetical protein [Nanoarchaeota archaeon]
MDLENLKNEYEKIQKKHKLPSFIDLNIDFDIEKLAEKESDLLIREVRRAMVDRVLVYLRFVETIMNPVNAPMFFMILTKHVDSKDKEILKNLYDDLGKLEIEALGIDNDYEEKKEADFINKLFKSWKSIKSDMGEISDNLRKYWDKAIEKSDKGYLG